MLKFQITPVLEDDNNRSTHYHTAYEAWRAGTSKRVIVLARKAGNRFLGFLKVHKIEKIFGFEFKF
jgi:hypothetical protein